MNFINGKELLDLCNKNNTPISEVMIRRELANTQLTREEILKKLEKSLNIMKDCIKAPLEQDLKSMGGLIGGEAKKLSKNLKEGKSICGSMLSKAITYSLGVLEVNTSMGIIVAAPTAGASGVVPGLLLSLKDEFDISDEILLKGLLNASAVGYILMRNGSVSGAEAGCQAEVGSASAMAASMAVEIMGGSPEQCLFAAATALQNLLGLVCDPVGGLVEVPCQARNSIGVSNALTCAEMALSGIKNIISFDEMVDVMLSVGKSMPFELRETALGGCAKTKSACVKCKHIK